MRENDSTAWGKSTYYLNSHCSACSVYLITLAFHNLLNKCFIRTHYWYKQISQMNLHCDLAHNKYVFSQLWKIN